jgi:hypothetical protein
MLFRFTRVLPVAAALAGILWTSAVRRPGENAWIRPVGAARPPVRILQFYASVGLLTKGEAAKLCYGVENARAVRISPSVDDVYPSPGRCVEIVPEHTTHYLLTAEGFDGRVATQSFTLAVQAEPLVDENVRYASVL